MSSTVTNAAMLWPSVRNISASIANIYKLRVLPLPSPSTNIYANKDKPTGTDDTEICYTSEMVLMTFEPHIETHARFDMTNATSEQKNKFVKRCMHEYELIASEIRGNAYR